MNLLILVVKDIQPIVRKLQTKFAKYCETNLTKDLEGGIQTFIVYIESVRALGFQNPQFEIGEQKFCGSNILRPGTVRSTIHPSPQRHPPFSPPQQLALCC